MEKPDYTDLIATVRNMRSVGEREAIDALRDYKRAWHEADLRAVAESVRSSALQIIHVLGVVAK